MSNDIATPAAPEKPASLWQQKTPQLEGMIAAGDRLLAATEDGRLQALDPTSGKTLWEAALKEAPVGAPVVVGPKVYVATESKLQAYALADGTGLWAREEEEPAGLCAAPDGTLYLTVKDQLVAYDAQSEELGRIRFGRAMFAPVCDADRVYAAWPGGLSAVNRKTGKNAWKVKLPGPLALERAHGLILVPTAATLTAFNCTSGAKAWEADLPGKPLGLSTSGDVTVVNCEDGQVVAFERDGTVRWQAHPEIELGVGPQVTEKAVLVAGVKAFHRLDLATGQELETFLTPDAWLPPVAMRDRVFLTASDSVTAYSTP